MKKSIIVTGAGHRVGFYISKELLCAGYNIIAHYRQCRTELEQWLNEHPEYEERVSYVQADLMDSCDPLVDLIKSDESICGLVNSASLFEMGDLCDSDVYARNIALNVEVPRKLIASFKDIRQASVVNIVDANIDRVNSRFQAYRVSKMFLREMTRQFAVTLAPMVRVNGVAPGTVLPPEGVLDESYLKARAKAPLGRDASLTDLTKAVLFLLENQSVTGEILSVDCGVHAL